MKALLKYWPVIVGAAGALLFSLRLSAAIQKHLDDDIRRDDRLGVLERIACAEHPVYCSTVYPKEK